MGINKKKGGKEGGFGLDRLDFFFYSFWGFCAPPPTFLFTTV